MKIAGPSGVYEVIPTTPETIPGETAIWEVSELEGVHARSQTHVIPVYAPGKLTVSGALKVNGPLIEGCAQLIWCIP